MNKNNNNIRIYCDGFLKYKGLKNGASVGLEENDSVVWVKRYSIKELSRYPNLAHYVNGKITNNIVEYFGMLLALMLANYYNVPKIYCDSELVVMQVNQEWVVNAEHLKPLNKACINAKKDTEIYWIKRNKIVEILGH